MNAGRSADPARRALLGLVGQTIGRSISPAMQEAAGAALGLDVRYHLIEADVLGFGAADLRRVLDGVRLLGGGLGVLLKVGGRMSVVMLLPSLALSTVTGLNVFVSIGLMGIVTTIYAMEGGFEAVIWTDVMQVGVTCGGVLVALYFLWGGVDGGFGALSRSSSIGPVFVFGASFSSTSSASCVFLDSSVAVTNIDLSRGTFCTFYVCRKAGGY